MPHRRYLTTLLAFAVAGGCATGASPRTARESTSGSSATVVTAEELARTGRRGSVMEALSLLRPFMLRSRGTTPRVSVDGSHPMEISVLRQIPVSDVRAVRLVRASAGTGRSAVMPNGDVALADVIMVSTWSGSRP